MPQIGIPLLQRTVGILLFFLMVNFPKKSANASGCNRFIYDDIWAQLAEHVDPYLETYAYSLIETESLALYVGSRSSSI